MYDVLDTLCLILGFVKSGVVCGDACVPASVGVCVVWRVSRWVGLVLRSWFVRFMCKQASKLVHVFVSCVCANLQNDAHARAHKDGPSVSRLPVCPRAGEHFLKFETFSEV